MRRLSEVIQSAPVYYFPDMLRFGLDAIRRNRRNLIVSTSALFWLYVPCLLAPSLATIVFGVSAFQVTTHNSQFFTVSMLWCILLGALFLSILVQLALVSSAFGQCLSRLMDEGHSLMLANQKRHSWLLLSILGQPASDLLKIAGMPVTLPHVVNLSYLLFTFIMFFAAKRFGNNNSQ
jgi:hypothetical protein